MPALRPVWGTLLYAALYVAVLSFSRFMVVDGVGSAPPVSLIAPSAGIAFVWLASARTSKQLAIDVVLQVGLAAIVLLQTDGTAVQAVLMILTPIQYLGAIYLMRRWTPQLWGAGGRASLHRLSEFGLVLAAMTAAVLVYGVLRTAVGELVIPEETWSLALGRATRSLAAMATIGVLGLLIGGYLTEARDAGRSPLTRPTGADLANLAGAAAATGFIFVFGFGSNPEAPTTFMLTLTVVWIAVRFGPLVTAASCLLIGGVGVWLTIVDIGPIAAVDSAVNQAAVAQVFVVVMMVLGMAISLSRRQVLDTVSDLERSQAANARRAAELDLVMANLNDGVAIIDGNGRILHSNHALQTAFGTQEPEELERVREDIPDDERLIRGSDGEPFNDENSPLAAALAGETVAPEEWRPGKEDGPIKWVTIGATPLPPDEDDVPRAMVVLRDISAEKIHQDALETRAAELNLVIDKLNDGLAIVEEGGHYVQSNDALRVIMTGAEETEVFEGDVEPPSEHHLYHPDGRPMRDDEYPYLRAVRGIEVHDEEYHLRRPGAASQILHISAYPLRVERGTKRRAMVVVRDITVERSYQDSLASFAGTVAHDLNNPLSVIDGWAEAIEEDLGDSEDPIAAQAAGMVQHIRGSVDQMRAFISDLLAHAVARDQMLRTERVPLRNMVKHIATSRDKPGLRGGGIVPGDLPDVWADRLLVRQVLDNLIGNALKYVASGVSPQIHVDSVPSGEGWVEVRVRDNGIGIEPAQRERVFDSFHRASQESYSGTGLGLAICKRIVERHGGRIWVEGNPEGGSCFAFTLPTTPEAFAAALDH